MLSKFKVSTKLFGLVVISVIGFVLVAATALSALRTSMLEDRIAKVRNLTEVARDIAAGFAAAAKGGKTDLPTAQAAAKDVLRGLRFDKVEYFFIYDEQGTSILLPPRPEREGKNFIDLKDSQGVLFIRELVRAGQSGGTPVFYKFPRAGSDEPIDKVSFALAIPEWHWVIGTGIYIDDVDTEFRATAIRFGALVIVIAGIVLIAAVALSRRISRPLVQLSSVSERMARGDYGVEVPETGRGDEIGLLSRSILVLRDEARAAADMRQAQEEAKRRQEIERRDMALRTAASFESSVKQVADGIATAAGRMQDTAQSMSDVAGDVSEQTASIAAAAEEASSNIGTVATATEELSASIQEIGMQVQRSSAISSGAVDEAKRANDLIASLSEAAGKIGQVVQLITDIASQTNLLALNATIEAARAGDAGKGFAVVAGEVKNLANQTAKATEEVSLQVATVQSATNQAVEAVRDIGGTIENLHDIATAIAAAVEEQNAATSEIARNVHQVTESTKAITSYLDQLASSTAWSRSTSQSVLDSSQGLSSEVNRLTQEAGTFLSSIREA